MNKSAFEWCWERCWRVNIASSQQLLSTSTPFCRQQLPTPNAGSTATGGALRDRLDDDDVEEE